MNVRFSLASCLDVIAKLSSISEKATAEVHQLHKMNIKLRLEVEPLKVVIVSSCIFVFKVCLKQRRWYEPVPPQGGLDTREKPSGSTRQLQVGEFILLVAPLSNIALS